MARRKLALLFGILFPGLLLGACNALPGPPPDHAPDSLSPHVLAAWDSHRQSLFPLYFMTSRDGHHAFMVRVDDLVCQTKKGRLDWIEKCAEQTGQKCVIAAQRGVPNWTFSMNKKPPETEASISLAIAECLPDIQNLLPDHNRQFRELLPR